MSGWKCPLKEVKKQKVALSTLRGEAPLLVVDISIWLHQIVSTIDEVTLFLSV
jgi:hypothetical protein